MLASQRGVNGHAGDALLEPALDDPPIGDGRGGTES